MCGLGFSSSGGRFGLFGLCRFQYGSVFDNNKVDLISLFLFVCELSVWVFPPPCVGFV
jgi:hypothetical protein